MRNFTTLFAALLFTFFYNPSQAQNKIIEKDKSLIKYKTSAYVTLFGATRGMGANFDMRLKPGTNSGLGFRVGVGGRSDHSGAESVSRVTIPMGINYLTGEGKSHFVAEGGILPTINIQKQSADESTSTSDFGIRGTYFLMGYRHQPAKSGFMWQIAWNPMILSDKGFSPMRIELGLGATF